MKLPRLLRRIGPGCQRHRVKAPRASASIACPREGRWQSARQAPGERQSIAAHNFDCDRYHTTAQHAQHGTAAQSTSCTAQQCQQLHPPAKCPTYQAPGQPARAPPTPCNSMHSLGPDSRFHLDSLHTPVRLLACLRLPNLPIMARFHYARSAQYSR